MIVYELTFRFIVSTQWTKNKGHLQCIDIYVECVDIIIILSMNGERKTFDQQSILSKNVYVYLFTMGI
jgi:hypothetical protein